MNNHSQKIRKTLVTFVSIYKFGIGVDVNIYRCEVVVTALFVLNFSLAFMRVRLLIPGLSRHPGGLASCVLIFLQSRSCNFITL